VRNNAELSLSAFRFLIASTLISCVLTPVSFAKSNESNLPLVCATRPEVLIRDFYTGNEVGKLDKGECMEVVPNIQNPDPAIRAKYLTVRGGKSGKLRLVSKLFVVYSDGSDRRNQKPSDPSPISAAQFVLQGTLTIYKGSDGVIGDRCPYHAPYADVMYGSTMTIRNELGEILAVTELPQGQNIGSDYPGITHCRVNIPATIVRKSKFYSVSVGRRGETTYSFEQLQERQWYIGLILGL
jgi:hypothetical protein